MWTILHPVDGPWPGKLALTSRPRGDDWIDDEMANWRRADAAETQGVQFISLPIADRQVPRSEAEVAPVLEKVDALLESGKNVVVHCRQGIGRTGLFAACLLVAKGWDSDDAVANVSKARGIPVPETVEQRQWIDRYAAVLSGTK